MEKILLGMSGGVDSSVSAYVLQEQGYEVVGMTMMLIPGMEKTDKFKSIVEDAARVAYKLGIKHYIADFREEFERNVISPFIDAYNSGYTPNPCIFCNKHIKFDLFLKYADGLGIDKIATGHYAFIKREGDSYRLMRGSDASRDQTYFLYSMTQKALSRTLFPLSHMTKTEARQLGEKIGLDIYNKKDSEEICFIPDDDYRRFLASRNVKKTAGNIVSTDGTIYGKHNGITDYTIGQRRGLGIALGQPAYVVGLDSQRSEVIIGTNSDLMSNGLIAKDVNLIAGEIDENKLYTVKIRHSTYETEAYAKYSDGLLEVMFKAPVRAVTPGQSAVIYDGEYVVGGGIICKKI